MSRPRKPFGPNPPGRLPATMVKVLAAELSDQGRLSRGKRYWADNAVLDVVIGHGAVTAEIQGSRPEPYVVTIEAAPGRGVPGRREVWIRCTCPDDSGVGDQACKHAVAALFAVSDEIAIEPELIERWRGGSRSETPPATRPEPDTATPALAEVVPLRRELRRRRTTDDLGREAARREPGVRDPDNPDAGIADPGIAEMARMLAAPGGALAPEFPDVSPIEHRSLRDRDLAEVLADALDQLAINWE